jgi:hypothetical protein
MGMPPGKSVMQKQTDELRRALDRAFDQYGLKAADLKDHAHAGRGKIECLNESERSMTCPCLGKSRDQIVRMVEKIRSRPVTAEYAYRVLCMVSAAKKTAEWRKNRDPGADDWLWAMQRAYLNGAEYAAPEPKELPALGPSVGIAPGAVVQFARELTAEVYLKSYVTKSRAGALERDIASFLRRRRDACAEGFVTWFMNLPYRVVVRDEVEILPMIIRTGAATSETHEVPIPKPQYEIHYAHLAPEGDRPPADWESLYVALTREMEKEARLNAQRRAKIVNGPRSEGSAPATTKR